MLANGALMAYLHTKGLKQNGQMHNPPTSKALRGLYSWEEQYGPSKSFDSREEFYE